jgi:hypothetical protein
MKKALCLIFLLSCSFLSELLPATSLIYDESLGDQKYKTTYHMSEKDGKRFIESDNEKEKYSMIFSTAYRLEKISFASKKDDNHYDLFIDGSTLVYEGKSDGKQRAKRFQLPSKPWIQNFIFGLIPFSSSSQTSCSFFIINTKDLTLYQMRAKKIQIETVTIQNKPCKAQKIEVRLAGFKGLFWKAEIWFDIQTHQMVRYQTNEGPNTPTDTLEFVSKHPSL